MHLTIGKISILSTVDNCHCRCHPSPTETDWWKRKLNTWKRRTKQDHFDLVANRQKDGTNQACNHNQTNHWGTLALDHCTCFKVSPLIFEILLPLQQNDDHNLLRHDLQMSWLASLLSLHFWLMLSSLASFVVKKQKASEAVQIATSFKMFKERSNKCRLILPLCFLSIHIHLMNNWLTMQGAICLAIWQHILLQLCCQMLKLCSGFVVVKNFIGGILLTSSEMKQKLSKSFLEIIVLITQQRWLCVCAFWNKTTQFGKQRSIRWLNVLFCHWIAFNENFFVVDLTKIVNNLSKRCQGWVELTQHRLKHDLAHVSVESMVIFTCFSQFVQENLSLEKTFFFRKTCHNYSVHALIRQGANHEKLCNAVRGVCCDHIQKLRLVSQKIEHQSVLRLPTTPHDQCWEQISHMTDLSQSCDWMLFKLTR